MIHAKPKSSTTKSESCEAKLGKWDALNMFISIFKLKYVKHTGWKHNDLRQCEEIYNNHNCHRFSHNCNCAAGVETFLDDSTA